MPQRKSNEGKVLDAVIRRIETRDGTSRADVRDPEAEKHESPLDQVCTLAGQLFALEHTEIEPVPDHIQIQKHNSDLLDPIAAALSDLAAPEECFQLQVPITASVGIKRARHERVQLAIVDWVRAQAPGIVARPYGTPGVIAAVQPPGIPFPVRLHRFHTAGGMGGRFDYVQVTPAGGEAQRVARLETACVKKYWKLDNWKRDDGARSVVVLEDRDMFLTSLNSVANALAEAEAARSDNPDEVYLVETYIEPWHVTCLRRPGHTYHEEAERFWEVDPATLTDLTGR